MYVLYYSYRILMDILLRSSIRQAFDLSCLNKEELREHHMPSQDGWPRSQKHQFYMVYPPNALFRSLLLSLRLDFLVYS